MNYKGYEAVVEYDDEAEIFHGQVINARDVITFQATTVEDLKREFAFSVDEYLRWCEEEGREPEKPFSGKLLVRLTPEEHRRVYMEAMRHKQSINQYIKNRLMAS